jgi:lipoic acid synthetase
MGETREEVSQALPRPARRRLRESSRITQYLAPLRAPPPGGALGAAEEFVEMAAEAEEIGFAGVLSGPLVRSSYRAGRLYRQAVESRMTSTVAQDA